MKSIFRDGRPLTYGGSGLYGSIPTNYIFSGDPVDTLNGWSCMTAGMIPESYILLGSHGPFDFKADTTLKVDIALVFGRDYQGDNIGGVKVMQERINDILYYYKNDTIPCNTSFWGERERPYRVSEITVYPNPGKEFLRLKGVSEQQIGRLKYLIRDITSRIIKKGYVSGRSIPIYDLDCGMYILSIYSDESCNSLKFLKQ